MRPRRLGVAFFKVTWGRSRQLWKLNHAPVAGMMTNSQQADPGPGSSVAHIPNSLLIAALPLEYLVSTPSRAVARGTGHQVTRLRTSRAAAKPLLLPTVSLQMIPRCIEYLFLRCPCAQASMSRFLVLALSAALLVAAVAA